MLCTGALYSNYVATRRRVQGPSSAQLPAPWNSLLPRITGPRFGFRRIKPRSSALTAAIIQCPSLVLVRRSEECGQVARVRSPRVRRQQRSGRRRQHRRMCTTQLVAMSGDGADNVEWTCLTAPWEGIRRCWVCSHDASVLHRNWADLFPGSISSRSPLPALCLTSFAYPTWTLPPPLAFRRSSSPFLQHLHLRPSCLFFIL